MGICYIATKSPLLALVALLTNNLLVIFTVNYYLKTTTTTLRFQLEKANWID